MRYSQAREQCMVVLEAWQGQEYFQIQENRQLLDRASTLMSNKADKFINKAIENTLKNCKFGINQYVDGKLGRPASTGGRQVRAKNSFVYLC